MDMQKDVLKLVENWLMRGPDELHRRIPDGLADAYSGNKGPDKGKQKGGQKGKGSDKGKPSDKGSWAWSSDTFMPAHVVQGYWRGPGKGVGDASSQSDNPEIFRMRQELERLRDEDRRRRDQDEEDRRRREQDEEDRRRREQDEEDRRRREQDEEGRRRREQEEEERRRKEEADRRRQERDERQRQEDLQRMREMQETDGTRPFLEPDRGRSEPDTTVLSDFERREARFIERQEAFLREMDRREEEMEREMARSRRSDHRPRHWRNWDAEDWYDEDWPDESGWRWGRYRWWCRMCQWRTFICCQTAANGRTYQPQAAEEQTIGPDLIAKKKPAALCKFWLSDDKVESIC